MSFPYASVNFASWAIVHNKNDLPWKLIDAICSQTIYSDMQILLK